MILFKEDWNKYPRAVPDFTTKNKTWLRFAYLLKQMGIENHLFHLSVLDPRVIGLDPHSEELTETERGIILQETKLNFWYSLREVQRVPANSGMDADYFRANKANICMYWLFMNHIAVMLVMLRQQGKSLSVDMLTIWLTEFAGKKLIINGSTKDDALRATNIRRLREIDKELPKWMQKQTGQDSRNLEEFTVWALGNMIRYTLPQKSKKLAELSGRGSTAGVYLGDEIAFQSNIAISLPAALAAGLAARDLAKEAGIPYGTILTTTAGSRDDPDGRFCYNLMMDSASWSESFYDAKNVEDLVTIVKGSSRTNVDRVAATFYYHQLGITDAWMEKAKADLMIHGDAALRDLYSIWTHSSGTHPINSGVLKKIKRNQKDPKYIQIFKENGYVIRWFLPQEEVESMENRELICTLDTSDAIGSDDIGMTIIDPWSGDVVGAGTYNRLNIISFSEWYFQLLMTFRKMVAVIERRSTGASVIDYLILALVKVQENPFKRLYNTYVQLQEEKPDNFEKVKEFSANMHVNDLHITNKKCFGFATSGSGLTSRNGLYSDILTSFSSMCGEGVHDAEIIKQLSGLMVINGRIDHGSDGNDDMCISWLLGGFLLLKGRGLSFYNITPSKILSTSKKVVSTSPKTLAIERKQRALREEMNKLTEEYRRTSDPFRLKFLRGRLKLIDAQVIRTLNENVNLDSVLEEMDKNKFKKDMMQESVVTPGAYAQLSWTMM